MSFILDALKKAEAERNRRIAPVLMDARIAPPRRGLPAWAWALGAVLLVNLALLGWLLWRAPAPVAESSVPNGSPTSAADSAAPAPATATRVAPPPAPSPPAQPVQEIPPRPAITPPLSDLTQAPPANQPASGDASDLPTLDELRAAGIALPALQLNLHVYDPAPAYRSVLLNGIRLREGEYTPDGVKVDRITPTGVVLEASERRFRLEVGG